MKSLSRSCVVLAGVMAAAAWGVLADQASAGEIREGPRACKAIALTFDLCPVREGTGYDAELVKTLIDRHIPATFFLSGRWMAKHDEQVRELLAVPFFEIGTHGHVHAHLPALDDLHQEQEIKQPIEILRTRYGRSSPLFRPPYGEYNEATVRIAEALGLRFILWNIVSGDPDPHLSRSHIVERVSAQARNGGIIVMHANGKGRYTRDVVQELHDRLIVHQGYRAVTVSTLLDQCRADTDHDQDQPGR